MLHIIMQAGASTHQIDNFLNEIIEYKQKYFKKVNLWMLSDISVEANLDSGKAVKQSTKVEDLISKLINKSQSSLFLERT